MGTIDLKESSVTIRETRLGSITGVNGSAKELVTCAHTGKLKDCSRNILDENGNKLEGEEGVRKLIDAQLEGIKKISDLGVIVKINSVLIPGINNKHIKEIARVTRELGASILNIISLIQQNELSYLEAPTCLMLDKYRGEAGEYLDVFKHCKHCRADACGVPGKNQDIHSQLYNKEVVETFSHG